MMPLIQIIKVTLVVALLTCVVRAENWPHWRGPSATGVSTETGLPHQWSDTENIAWKAPVRGLGISSPVVWGDRVFVTSQIGRGARRPGNHPSLVQGGNPADAGERALGGSASGAPNPGTIVFLVTALSRLDGRKLWEYKCRPKATLPRSTTSTTSRLPARSRTASACMRGSVPARW